MRASAFVPPGHPEDNEAANTYRVINRILERLSLGICQLLDTTDTMSKVKGDRNRPSSKRHPKARLKDNANQHHDHRDGKSKISKILAKSIVQMARVNTRIEVINEALRTGKGEASNGLGKKSEDRSADALLQACDLGRGIHRRLASLSVQQSSRSTRSAIVRQKKEMIARLGQTMAALTKREYPLTWKRLLNQSSSPQ